MWIPHVKEGWICGEIHSIDAGGKNELVVIPEDGGEVRKYNMYIPIIALRYGTKLISNIHLLCRKLELQKTKLC